MKNKIIFTGFIADFLIERGEKLKHVRPDLKDPKSNVFVFEDSETFDRNMTDAIEAQADSRR